MLTRLAYLLGYSAATIISAVGKFFIVTLLIRNMGAYEFGRWSLFEPAVVILSQLALMGVNFGLIKQINQDNRSPIVAVKSLLLALQPALIAVGVVVFLISSRLGLAWPSPLFLAFLIYTESIFLLLFASYRASASIGAFVASSILKVLVVVIAFGLALNYRWPRVHKAEDVIFWSFLASLIGLGVGFLMVRLLHFRVFFAPGKYSKSYWRTYIDAMGYGLPLLATGLLAMVIEFAGRYILNSYIDHSQLANYVVYMKISSMLEVLVVAPFTLWWPTERFRELESKDGGRRFFRVVDVGLLALLLVAGGILWIISVWIVPWFAPGVPFDRYIILLLIFSTVARGMAYPLNVGALKEGKTHWNIYGVLAAAVVNILLCFLLIPGSSIVGAAYAAMLSYFCYTAFLTLISQHIHPLPIPYLTMLIMIIISVSLLFVVQKYLGTVSVFLKAISFSSFSLVLYTPFVWSVLREKHARRS